MNRRLAASGAVVALCVGTWLWLARLSQARLAPPRAPTADVAGDEEAPRAVRWERPAPVRPAHAAAPADGDGLREVPAEGPGALSAPLYAHEVQPYLEEVLQGEPVDASWATSAWSVMSAAIRAALPPNGSVGSIECRTSLCRFEVKVRSPDESEAFLDRLFCLGPSCPRFGPVIIPKRTDDESGHGMVVYVAREGRSLPTIEVLPDEDQQQ